MFTWKNKTAGGGDMKPGLAKSCSSGFQYKAPLSNDLVDPLRFSSTVVTGKVGDNEPFRRSSLQRNELRVLGSLSNRIERLDQGGS